MNLSKYRRKSLKWWLRSPLYASRILISNLGKALPRKWPLPKPLQLDQQYDYNADSLRVWNKNIGFLSDSAFQRAYAHRMNSDQHIGQGRGARVTNDIHIEWRIHTLLWAVVTGAVCREISWSTA